MTDTVVQLPRRRDEDRRPPPQPGEGAYRAELSVSAAIAWLPAHLRPTPLAARLAAVLLKEGRPAALGPWEEAKAELRAVLADRGLRGRHVEKVFEAWRFQVGQFGKLEKAKAEARERQGLRNIAEFVADVPSVRDDLVAFFPKAGGTS